MIDEPTQAAATAAIHPALAVLYCAGGIVLTWRFTRALCARFPAHPAPQPERNLAPVAVVALIALVGFELLFGGVVPWIVRSVFGEAAAAHPLVSIGLGCALNVCTATIAIAFANRRLGVGLQPFGLRLPALADFAFAALLFVAFVPAYLGAAALNDAVGRAFDLPARQRIVDAVIRGDLVLNPITVLMIVAVVPFCEELLFRGVFFTFVAQVRAPWVAVFATACFFAVLHDPQSVILIVVIGVMLGIVRLRTGSLLASTFVHGIFNALMLAYIAHQAGTPAN